MTPWIEYDIHKHGYKQITFKAIKKKGGLYSPCCNCCFNLHSPLVSADLFSFSTQTSKHYRNTSRLEKTAD